MSRRPHPAATSKKKKRVATPERVGIYHCWDAGQSKPPTPDQFKACGFADAATQFAQLYWDMGGWLVTHVGVDNDDGEQRVIEVKRVDGFEAVR